MEFNSITVPEGKVIKIFANNILIWKISSSTTILPLTNSPSEICGWWNNNLYQSTIAANVYTPAQYPAGWILIQ